MNKISRLWALVITISVLALGAVVANDYQIIGPVASSA
ncbi:unannotated protein [freshwater metagenome]|uniref:Unannotated protein n=1 Tax=freshwater metagenome TaxID=449393 RepID=A0A6J6RI88_9ZZZZ